MAFLPTVRYLPDWHLHQGHIPDDRKRVGLGQEYARRFGQDYRAAEKAMASQTDREPMRPVIVRRRASQAPAKGNGKP